MTRLSPPVILAAPGLVVAIVVAAVIALIGSPVWLAAVIGVAVGALVGLVLWHGADRLALRALRAEPLDPASVPRLSNVVEGLCAMYGYPEPRLHRVDESAPNAAILGRSDREAHLVVTAGLLEELDRLELEAVAARMLSQLRRGVEGATALVTVARLASPLGLRDRVLDRALDRRSMIETDVESVRQTRYPPALASAYEKAVDVRPLDADPTADHLWLLGTTTGRPRGVAHPPLADRIDVLREL